MKAFFFLIFAAVLTSCKFDPQSSEQVQSAMLASATTDEPKQAEEPTNTDTATETESQHEYVDSFKIQMDSLMAADIKLPPIYKHDIITANEHSVSKFTNLATATGGNIKILVNSELVAKEVIHTINTISQQKSDLLLLIDKTGSMGGDIACIKHSLSQIIDTIKKYKGTRLAIAMYGDKNADVMKWYSFKNFETNYEEARQYLNSIKVEGGGDWPESVYDAIMKSFEQDFWKSEKKRNIILVGDAPPLERPLSDYGLSEVIAKSKQGGVIMNFYPIIITPAAEDAKVETSEVATYKPTKLTTSLYPNPCKGTVNVGFEENDTYYVEVYNASGQVVVSEEAYGISWTKDLGNVPDGMYIARVINSAHKFELIKFILQR